MTLSPPSLRGFRFPVLVADIGGTNARFAIVTDTHAATKVYGSVPTADFPGLAEAAIATVLDHTSVMPRTAVLAVAGPVTGDRIPMTNADWVIVVLMVSSLLNAMYFLPILYRAWFVPQDGAWPDEHDFGRFETHWMMLTPPVTTAVFSVLLGLLASLPYGLVDWVELIIAREYIL